MTKPAHSGEDAVIYRRIAAGDRAARNAMVERHLGLASAVATYYAKRNPHLDMRDLLQEGRIGIIVALEKFNVDKGWRFSTYATYWIRHHVQRFVVANHSGGLSSTRKDTEAYLGLRMTDDERAMYDQRCIDTLSMSWANEAGQSFEGVVVGDEPDDVEMEVLDTLDRDGAVHALLSDLVSDDQRRVLGMRYGILGQRPQKAEQVARRMKLPLETVERLERETVALLRDLLEGN